MTATHDTSDRVALVIGASRPFGQEIVRRLAADYATVAIRAEDLSPDQQIDALVLNMPVAQTDIRFRDLTEDDFRAALEPGLYEPVAAVQFASPRMRAGGAIVLVASTLHLGGWGHGQDCAVGAAIVAMGRSMALELTAAGIRVNTLAPDPAEGATDTPATREALAETVAWFASPASSLISGETILVNRGKSLQMAQARKR